MKNDKLLKFSSVLEYVQISKTKLYEMMKKGEFPKPSEVDGCRLWSHEAVQEFIERTKNKVA